MIKGVQAVNLGIRNGLSVLGLIESFEAQNAVAISYKIVARRKVM